MHHDMLGFEVQPSVRLAWTPEVACGETVPPAPISGRIFLVDDELEVVAVIENLLKHFGNTVDAFSSSRAALSAFRAALEQWDLVVTDHAMPALTGMELAREVLGLRPDLPVLLCTGYADEAAEQVAMAHGVFRVARKPLLAGELRDLVYSALRHGEKLELASDTS